MNEDCLSLVLKYLKLPELYELLGLNKKLTIAIITEFKQRILHYEDFDNFEIVVDLSKRGFCVNYHLIGDYFDDYHYVHHHPIHNEHISKLANIYKLDLSYCRFITNECLGYLKNTNTLTIWLCEKINTDCLKYLKCPSIEKLYFVETAVGNELFENVPPSVVEFSIEVYVGLNDEHFRYLPHTNIRKLHIEYPRNLTDKTLEYVMQSKVKKLHLYYARSSESEKLFSKKMIQKLKNSGIDISYNSMF